MNLLQLGTAPHHLTTSLNNPEPPQYPTHLSPPSHINSLFHPKQSNSSIPPNPNTSQSSNINITPK